MADLLIRAETPEDVDAIRALTTAAFEGQPFSDGGEAGIIDRLRTEGDLALSLVAELGGEIVGHVALSSVSVGEALEGWFGLGPISVAPVSQGQGHGAALMRAALAWLSERDAAGCVLVGDPGYYGRFGFRTDGTISYLDVPGQFVLKIVLSGPDARGEVRYAPAFGGA